MSEIKVNKISPKQTCTTVTLGDSGDTFIIPSGVTITNNGTQTGFGRTGTVNWDTTAKTASFTAVSGNGYFVNTTSGAITVTLPATPSAGDIVAVADYANTFATNNLTIARNGSLINGEAFNYVSSTNGISLTFVYVDGTRGWKNVNDGTTDATGLNPFIEATGGTVICCGDFKIHTFTGPGTFTVTNAGTPAGSTTVDYLVVAGGGGGGKNRGGGGGAGGFRESVPSPAAWTASPLANPGGALPVAAQAYPITVGGAGSGATPCQPDATTTATGGTPSVFSTITSTGGGAGGNRCATGGGPGGSGGGGGSSGPSPAPSGSGGNGNTPPTSPPQGNNGGGPIASAQALIGGSGGGGATAAGVTTPISNTANSGPGGNGATTSISGSPTAYAGGGGGGAAEQTPFTPASGGTGGGGNGGGALSAPGDNATTGTTNTGGGGGGGAGSNSPGKNGGSGVVIIRYKFQ